MRAVVGVFNQLVGSHVPLRVNRYVTTNTASRLYPSRIAELLRVAQQVLHSGRVVRLQCAYVELSAPDGKSEASRCQVCKNTKLLKMLC